ncbi:MAG: ribbon-helix-helix protein, CopG family [Candidatus Omnitrophica bacterium]|nr:ribbon-helix-helix protein, CopG family [Candidatus Omnitrophota bacterium]
MRSLLSVSLPDLLAKDLKRLTKEMHLTRSEVVKLALRNFLIRYQLDTIRRRLVPKARAKGIFTEEDVFRMIRS